jgi:hypothetical protein
LTIVGRSRSRTSSTPAAVAELEQTSRPPATSVPSSAYAKPPIQKKGEFANSTSSGVYDRSWLRLSR